MKTQFHVQNASGLEDRLLVEKILVSAAAKFGIADTTVTSRVPDTIRCYSERIGYGFAIGARVVGEIIIVDFYAGREPSPNFHAVEDYITSEMRRIFAERITIPTASENIAIKSSLPESKAEREFNRKHFEMKHQPPLKN